MYWTRLAKVAQQMGLITVNTQNFKITKPPERRRTEVKTVQMADEIVAGYPEVFQRELGALPGTVHLKVEQGATPVITPLCETEEQTGLTTAVRGHSPNE